LLMAALSLLGALLYLSQTEAEGQGAKFTCKSGGTLVVAKDGSASCVAPATATTGAPTLSCPAGATLAGTNCASPATNTPTFACTTGTLTGTNCVSPATSTPKSPVLSCAPGTGGLRADITPPVCLSAPFSTTAPPTVTYNCTGKTGTLVGTVCVDRVAKVTTTVKKVTTTTCPANYSLSTDGWCYWSTPANAVTTPGAKSVSCKVGTLANLPSGSTCVSPVVSTPQPPVLSCPAGSTLTGTNCVAPATATPNYTCATGTLTPVTGAAPVCVSPATSTPGKVVYSCKVGTLAGTNCILPATPIGAAPAAAVPAKKAAPAAVAPKFTG